MDFQEKWEAFLKKEGLRHVGCLSGRSDEIELLLGKKWERVEVEEGYFDTWEPFYLLQHHDEPIGALQPLEEYIEDIGEEYRAEIYKEVMTVMGYYWAPED